MLASLSFSEFTKTMSLVFLEQAHVLISIFICEDSVTIKIIFDELPSVHLQVAIIFLVISHDSSSMPLILIELSNIFITISIAQCPSSFLDLSNPLTRIFGTSLCKLPDSQSILLHFKIPLSMVNVTCFMIVNSAYSTIIIIFEATIIVTLIWAVLNSIFFITPTIIYPLALVTSTIWIFTIFSTEAIKHSIFEMSCSSGI